MNPNSFEVVCRSSNVETIESSLASAFFECSLPSVREKERNSLMLSNEEPITLEVDCSLSTEEINEKLNSLIKQNSELKEKFHSTNKALRDEITGMNKMNHDSLQEVLEENRKLKEDKDKLQQIISLIPSLTEFESTCQHPTDENNLKHSSDDESDYSIIVPFEGALSKKIDESLIFKESLLELHDLKSNHSEICQSLSEEKQKSANLLRLLEEKDEQNKILKQVFENTNRQEKKSVQLQLELDLLKSQLLEMKGKLEKSEESYDRSCQEVATYKEKYQILQTSTVDLQETLQTKIKLLQESLDQATYKQNASEMSFAKLEKEFNKVSEENENMVELLSSLKVQNEELKSEKAVQDRQYQETLDDVTAKLFDADQKLQMEQEKINRFRTRGIFPLPWTTTQQNPSTSDGLPLNGLPVQETVERDAFSVLEETEAALKEPAATNDDEVCFARTCPQCFLLFDTKFHEYETHVQNCCELHYA